ncbi:MAG: hypothetical protein WCH04_22435 [Gammaproteobacteria bacterium]
MVKRHHNIPVWFYLPVLLLVVACSNDEAPVQPNSTKQISTLDAASDLHAGSGFDPIKEYDAQCSVEDDDQSLECDWLHALVVADVVEALEEIERSRDKRGVDEALAALSLDDEPEILIAACRILGRFPDTPGIAEKVKPLLLDSPYFEVQKISALVFRGNPDQELAAIAGQWLTNHEDQTMEDPYDELPGIPVHFATMEFPVYPGAVRYAPADSDRSVGWWTPDSPSAVTSRLGEALGVEVINRFQWNERTQQQMMNALKSIDQSKIDEIEKLSEEYIKTQDPKIIERMDSLQKEIAGPMQQMSDDAGKSVDDVIMPPGSLESEQVYYLVAEEKAGHIARVIVVYRQPAIKRTVIQMAWDLRDYPRAWGEAH